MLHFATMFVLALGLTAWANAQGIVKNGGSVTVPGADTQCIFNDGGALGADAGCVYNKTTDILTLTGGLYSASDGTMTIGQAAGNRPSIVAYGLASSLAASPGIFTWQSGTSGTRIEANKVSVGSGVVMGWSSGDPNAVAPDSGLARAAAGVLEVNNGTAGTLRDVSTRQTLTTPVAVGSLQTCNAGNKGARSFVTDANAATFMTTAAGGGANNVPVVCDGTNWKIG